MATVTLAPTVRVEEYLRTSYAPDCDFVDGHFEERNLGERDHSRIQTLIAIWFGVRERDWGILVLAEQRVQVLPTRIRVPDVCVMRVDQPVEQIVRHAPLICIEVLSPDDTYMSMREKVGDYHEMGVENVWLVNPAFREGQVCTPAGWNRPADDVFTIPGTAIRLPLAEIFAGLDAN